MTQSKLSGRRIAVLATNGFEQSELTEPKRLLEEAGAKVDVISPGGAKQIKGWSKKDWGDTVKVDVALKDAKSESYDALVLPGGVMNPDLLRLEPLAIALIRSFGDAGKPIAAICHAAQVLAAAGVVEGKKCSAYPAVGPEVTRAGGQYVEVAMSDAVVDGNLVTAPAWPAHPAWLSKFLTVLGTRIEL